MRSEIIIATVTGLVSNPQLNQKQAQVIKYLPHKDRYEVRILSDDDNVSGSVPTIALKHSNLIFSPGTSVNLHSLVTASLYNGKDGVIVQHMKDKSCRYKIELINSNECLLVKSDNFIVLTQDKSGTTEVFAADSSSNTQVMSMRTTCVGRNKPDDDDVGCTSLSPPKLHHRDSPLNDLNPSQAEKLAALPKPETFEDTIQRQPSPVAVERCDKGDIQTEKKKLKRDCKAAYIEPEPFGETASRQLSPDFVARYDKSTETKMISGSDNSNVGPNGHKQFRDTATSHISQRPSRPGAMAIDRLNRNSDEEDHTTDQDVENQNALPFGDETRQEESVDHSLDMPIAAEVVQKNTNNDDHIEERVRHELERIVQETPRADIVPEATQNKTPILKRRILISATAFVVLLVVIAVTLVVTIGTSKGDDSSPGPNETTDELERVQELLIKLSPASAPYLLNQTTPQYEALAWLLLNEHLSNYSDARIVQRWSLATLYFTTNGGQWTNEKNWLDTIVDECYWHNTFDTTCDYQGRMLHLGLNKNNLRGSIPFELSLLSSSLQSLNFAENVITGSLSSEIFMLTRLASLNVSGNKLIGHIPSEIGLLSSATDFDVSINGLTGTIPVELGFMLSANLINIGGNKLSGSLPTEIGLLSVSQFIMNDTKVGGSIPSEIGQMGKSMEELEVYLHDNDLTNAIPTEIGLMSDLKYLDLSNNELSNTVPSEVGLLRACEDFELNENAVSGEIPTEVGLMSSLSLFDLSGNSLTSTIPSEIGLANHIALLYLDDNLLEGQIPSEIGMFKDLIAFWVQQNKLVGTMPEEVCELKYNWLITLWVDCEEVNCTCCDLCW